MNDRAELSRFLWQYIVVDESHRLKNANCKLLHELRRYPSANRLLLTVRPSPSTDLTRQGTPLHNNLQELWALLNFILPDIFYNLESFQSWFDIDVESQNDVFSDEQQQSILSNLHAILKPFLLRRMKADVESALPPKKECVDRRSYHAHLAGTYCRLPSRPSRRSSTTPSSTASCARTSLTRRRAALAVRPARRSPRRPRRATSTPR